MLGLKYFSWSIVMALVFDSSSVNRAQSDLLEATSPDHRITLRFDVQPQKGHEAEREGQLVYFVSFHEKPSFENSALRLELADQPPLGAAVHIAGTTPGSGVDDYRLLAGKASAIHDAYNSLTVHALESASPGRKFDIEARVYNGVVAFRYHVPEQAALSRYQLIQEDTEFRPVTDALAWALRFPTYQSAYESEYVPQALSALSNQGGVERHILNGAPMLMHVPGVG